MERTNLWIPSGEEGWGELADWDSHIYTTDRMNKVRKQ